MRAAAFGQFELIERIGRGASGEVWRAIEPRTNRVVAIKVLAAGIGPQTGEREAHLAWRFQREVEAAAQQDHPHIARVFSSGVIDGRPWCSMELIDGLPIDACLAEHDWDPAARLRLFLLICGAVQHAHDRGVIHRDLKPANILVCPDGTPRILDFGLARFLDDGGLGATLSLDGQPLGTPMFMAPEQAEGRTGEIGVAADVYSLGVILYHLATGGWPYDETLPPLQLATAVCVTDPRPPRTQNPSLSRDLAAIVTKAMAHAKDERYPGVRALAEDLEHFLAGEPVTVPATEGSIEYGVTHLKTHVVVVMGHEGCGAVKAAMLPKADWQAESENIRYLVEQIAPAVAGLPPIRDSKSRLREAVIANVRVQTHRLKENPVVAAAIKEGKLAVIGAYYEIGSGAVDFLETDEDLRLTPDELERVAQGVRESAAAHHQKPGATPAPKR